MSKCVATLRIEGRSDSRFEYETVPSVGDTIVVYPDATPARERLEAAVTAIQWHVAPRTASKVSKAQKPRASLVVIASEVASKVAAVQDGEDPATTARPNPRCR